jgi:hypothetical protein
MAARHEESEGSVAHPRRRDEGRAGGVPPGGEPVSLRDEVVRSLLLRADLLSQLLKIGCA